MAALRCPVVVGRARELASARRAMSRLRAGRGGFLGIAGEAGIGKSRLASAIVDQAHADGALVVVGRAVPTGVDRPYRPLTEVIQQALRDRPLLADDPALAPWLAPLGPIVPTLGVERQRDATQDLSAAVRGEAVLQVLRRAASHRALLMVLEDLHWADPDTLAIVEYLADNLADQRILCVATYRNDTSVARALAERLAARGSARILELHRLSSADVDTMARACRPELTTDAVEAVADISEGLPFLVEELVTSPGLPRSFADEVRERLGELSDTERSMLTRAAALGVRVERGLLAAATGLDEALLAGAVERCVAAGILRADGDTVRFWHMLTREAVTAVLLPPRRKAAMATETAAALDAALPGWAEQNLDLAADLALQAGNNQRAGALLAAAGNDALTRGALATATDSLHRAAELLDDPSSRAEATLLEIEALAQAGRADEARRLGEQALTARSSSPASRAQIQLILVRSAVDAADWDTAEDGLNRLMPARQNSPHATVLRAEIALARHDTDRALALAQQTLTDPRASAPTICHAETLSGRILRSLDLDAAREAFGRALSAADAADLPIWRLRALHELGTIEMFARGNPDGLAAARRLAEELGALGTAAMLDLQLSGLAIFRFDPEAATRHAQSALVVGQRLGLVKLTGLVLVFLAEAAALRRDAPATHHWLSRARSVAPGDPEIEGSAQAGALGMLAVLNNDTLAAATFIERGVTELDRLPQQGPAPYRGLWPLMQAARGDPAAATSIADARRRGLTVSRLNVGLLGWADAILAGRAGNPTLAADLARAAEQSLRPYGLWADLARMYGAEQGCADGWGTPDAWLSTAAASFTRHHIEPLASRCRNTLERPRPTAWTRLGITEREAEVLRLVAEGWPNKTIASRLHRSHRTIEKHIESLLRKTNTHTRTELVAVAGPHAAWTQRWP